MPTELVRAGRHWVLNDGSCVWCASCRRHLGWVRRAQDAVASGASQTHQKQQMPNRLSAGCVTRQASRSNRDPDSPRSREQLPIVIDMRIASNPPTPGQAITTPTSHSFQEVCLETRGVRFCRWRSIAMWSGPASPRSHFPGIRSIHHIRELTSTRPPRDTQHARANRREEGRDMFLHVADQSCLFLFCLLPRHESLIPAYPATDAN